METIVLNIINSIFETMLFWGPIVFVLFFPLCALFDWVKESLVRHKQKKRIYAQHK
jgi:hypothetical protein